MVTTENKQLMSSTYECCLKEHAWSRVCAVDVVSIYYSLKMMLNSASGIESGHQAKSQDRDIIPTNIESSWKERTGIRQNKWK